jgi:hypothetical protein
MLKNRTYCGRRGGTQLCMRRAWAALQTVNGGSADSAYKLSGRPVWKAPVARRSPVLWPESITDSLDFLAAPYTKLPQTILERISAWQSRSNTVRSSPQDRPDKTFKIFSDRSHFTCKYLTWGSLDNLLSRMRPRNLSDYTNGRTRFLRDRQGSGCKPPRCVKS